MAVLTNQDGTKLADTLTYTQGGAVAYHTYAGNDTVNITRGSVSVINDSGTDTINVKGGSDHMIEGVGASVENITITNAKAVDALLGSGRDTVTISSSDGKKASGALSVIRGGDWTDTFNVNINTQNYQIYGDAGDDIFNITNGKNINFWGGAANDTFNVTGGSNNKLYGGDSADLFEINASYQNMILGYGNDIVNVYKGTTQNIKANLGINEINLMGGSNHVITSDIDQAASKKAGKEVGYGVDKVFITGSNSVTANLGDGKDIVEIQYGYRHKIYTEGWGDTVNLSGGDTVKNNLIDTGAGDDIVTVNGGRENEFHGGEGNDTFVVTNDKNSFYYGDEGNDSFEISGGAIKELHLGSGNDKVQLADGSINTLTLDSGNNTIEVTGGSIENITESTGKDTLTLSGGKVYTAALGSGDDVLNILEGAEANTIALGAGDNIANLEGGKVETLTFGAGADTVNFLGIENLTINTLAGDDVINLSAGTGLNISTGEGEDAVKVTGGDNNIVKTGDGADTLVVEGGSANISTEAGEDLITIKGGQGVVIDAGNDVDTITVEGGNEIQINAGAGDDSIVINTVTTATINGGSGNDTIQVLGGTDMVINAGDGDDSFEVTGGSANKLYGGSGNDSFELTEVSGVELDGGYGKDTFVLNNVTGIQADGGADDDSFEVTGGSDNKILGGAGNDSFVLDNATGVEVEGGAGNDTFTLKAGTDIYIKGGTGNDTYVIDTLDEFGKYTIDLTGAGKTDKQFLDFSKFSKQDFTIDNKGTDTILTGINGAEITIRGWDISRDVTIKFSDTDAMKQEEVFMPEPGVISTSQQELMRNFVAVLNYTDKTRADAVDEAVKITSMGRFESAQAAVKEFTDKIMATYTYNDATKLEFLAENCGINVNNADTGAISGSDCGGAVSKDAHTIVPDTTGVALEDLVYDSSNKVRAISFVSDSWKEFSGKTVGGVTFYWDDSLMNNYVTNYGVAREIMEQTIAGIIDLWAPNAMQLIEESYGLRLDDFSSRLPVLADGTRGVEISFTYNTNPLVYAYPIELEYENRTAGYLQGKSNFSERLVVNLAYLKNGIGDVEGNIGWKASLDRCLTRALCEGAIVANTNKGERLSAFIREGLAELVIGIDDVRKDALGYTIGAGIGLTSGDKHYNRQETVEYYYGLDEYYTQLEGTVTAGYNFLRYYAKEVMDYAASMSMDSSMVGTGEMVDICINPDITLDPTKNLVAGSK